METIEYYFQFGPQQGQSKGLFPIALEFGAQVLASIKLNQVKSILSTYRTFQNVSVTKLLTF